MKKIVSAIGLGLIISGCYNDKADELYPTTSVAVCDTSDITFTKDILPIMQQKCAVAACHDGTRSGGYEMSGYTGLKLSVDDCKLLGALRWETGYSQMPKGMSKLDECSINKIARWVHQGALNN